MEDLEGIGRTVNNVVSKLKVNVDVTESSETRDCTVNDIGVATLNYRDIPLLKANIYYGWKLEGML